MCEDSEMLFEFLISLSLSYHFFGGSGGETARGFTLYCLRRHRGTEASRHQAEKGRGGRIQIEEIYMDEQDVEDIEEGD